MEVKGLKQLELLIEIRLHHSEGFSGSIVEWERKLGYKHTPNYGRALIELLIREGLMRSEGGVVVVVEGEFDRMLLDLPIFYNVNYLVTRKMSAFTVIKKGY